MMNGAFKKHWYDPDAIEIWSERSTVQTWFEVEVALAQAQADIGLIPPRAAELIARKADAAQVDMDRLAHDIAFTLHPFVPALRQLEELCGEEAAAYLHWGATTQNIFDTATALQLKRSHELLLGKLDTLLTRMADIASEHRLTIQAGRTHGQHALPISFGFKVAAWMAELRRHVVRLRELECRVFIARMGGAVGTFAAMDGHGRQVQRQVSERLGLKDGGLPSRSAVDHFGEYVCALSLFAATAEKIANNLIFLQRTELGEAGEGFHDGQIGSSTMAQKRNPALLMMIAGLARLLRLRAPGSLDAMVQMDEADGAATNLCDTIVPEAAIMSVSLAMHLDVLFSKLEINVDAMKANLARSRGLIMTEAVMMRLAPHIGRHKAHRLLYDVAMTAFEQGESLADALKRRPDIVGLFDLDDLLDPKSYLGEAPACVDTETGLTSK